MRQVVFAEILDELEGHFQKIQVPYMPIKGAYLIKTGLAQKMKRRKMVDIDILVFERDFKKTCAYFESLPNVCLKEWRVSFERAYWYVLGGGRFSVEIHRALSHKGLYVLPAQRLFASADRRTPVCHLPCIEHALLIQICHLLSHMWMFWVDTFFEETDLISGQPGFSWEKFWGEAKTTGILPFIGFALTLYRHTTGKLVELPCKFRSSEWLERKWSPGIYRQEAKTWRRLFLEIYFCRNAVTFLLSKLRDLLLRCFFPSITNRKSVGTGLHSHLDIEYTLETIPGEDLQRQRTRYSLDNPHTKHPW